MPDGNVSASQMSSLAAAAAARLRGTNLYPTKVPDNPDTLGDPLGGWDIEKYGSSPEAHSELNLSNAQKPFAFRSPDNVGIGKNTIGTWQGMEPSWHQRYKSQ